MAQAVVAALGRQLQHWRRGNIEEAERATGIERLDAILPGGGLMPGTLTEWLAERGSGAAGIAIHIARTIVRQTQGWLVIIDPRGEWYPPALAATGIPLDRLILVRPRNKPETCWAWDQTLRCRAVQGVVGHLERIDSHTFRRLQLAAEQGGGSGFLLRTPAMETEPSWAPLRIRVEADVTGQCERRWQLTLLRGPGGASGKSFTWEPNDADPLRLASRLADPTPFRRRAHA